MILHKIMDEQKNTLKVSGILIGELLFLFALSSCIPIMHTRHSAIFKNCTKDTLLIGDSYFDDIDSVVFSISAFCDPQTLSSLDTTTIAIMNGKKINQRYFILPDSVCLSTEEEIFYFYEKDTCFLFLIKSHDVKKYSWDEICSKKLYRKWVVVRDKDGNYDKNIEYLK